VSFRRPELEPLRAAVLLSAMGNFCVLQCTGTAAVNLLKSCRQA
jgi:hypothetical protein